MKSGIIRKVDELGRIVIPMEMRRSLDIGEGAALEISLENGGIRLDKPVEGCTFCGTSEFLTRYKGKAVCAGCVSELRIKRGETT